MCCRDVDNRQHNNQRAEVTHHGNINARRHAPRDKDGDGGRGAGARAAHRENSCLRVERERERERV